MELKPIPRKSLAQHAKDPLGVEFILERHDGIVGEADNGTLSRKTWPHLVLEPFVQHMMQEDVRETRRDHTALRAAFSRVAEETVFQDSRLEPLVDHPSDHTIRDPLVKKVAKLRVRYRLKVLFDVDIDHPSQPLAHTSRPQKLQRVMGRTARPEAEGARQEVLLIHRLQHHDDGALRHLILEGRNAERPTRAIRLWNVAPAYRRCLIATRLDAVEEIQQVGLQV